ncbi:MAG: 1,4-dihydroxy-6-naphthoate synthase [Bacteroidales bacterium]|nr:1,4-dihydroxy-6-naphthoate synthase [Bacteroidales bacterium]
MTPLPLFFSPCPNDTFCFHAMVNHIVDTEGMRFEAHLEDVEQLNHRAKHSDPHLCKISYQLLPQIAHRYRMLPCGSALGFGNGPLLVAREPLPSMTSQTRIAIPGNHTTANFLLKFAYPQAVNTQPLLFSEIAGAVLQNRFDAGVLIHEGRFVYKQQGLHLIADLGVCWESHTGLPVPLGGIAVSRKLPDTEQQKLARILHRSIGHALAHPSDSQEYVYSHARELEPTVVHNHIKLFVNHHTLDLGERGQMAVIALCKLIASQQNGPDIDWTDIFVPLISSNQKKIASL